MAEYTEKDAVVADASAGMLDDELQVNTAKSISFEEALAKLEESQPNKKKSNQKETTLSIPTLSTLLSQALKANDVDLLETCLNQGTEQIIVPTLQRLDVQYVLPLLEKLAERVGKRTRIQSKAGGGIGFWIQGVLLVHGGWLVATPQINKKLSILHSALLKHAQTLPRLLALRGRLELLSKQMDLMRNTEENLRSKGAVWKERRDSNGVLEIKRVEHASEDEQLQIEDHTFIDQDEDDDEDEDEIIPGKTKRSKTNGDVESDLSESESSSGSDELEDDSDEEVMEEEEDLEIDMQSSEEDEEDDEEDEDDSELSDDEGLSAEEDEDEDDDEKNGNKMTLEQNPKKRIRRQ